MFSKLFGCCAKGTYSAELYEIEDERNCAIDMLTGSDSAEKAPNKKRGGFLRWHRRTQEEQIIHYEKRYLKKFLRHYRMYVTGMTVDQMRMARRLVTMTMLGGDSSTSSQDRGDEKNFCTFCCHCFGCAGRRNPAGNAIAQADPKPVEAANELVANQVTPVSGGGAVPSRIVAEAKRVMDQIRQENAQKQTGPPETVAANGDGGGEGQVCEQTTADEGVKTAEEPKTEVQRTMDEEIKPVVIQTTSGDKRPSSAEEGDPDNAESEPDSDDDEMLGFIGQGRYVSFEQPDCGVEDCR
ncbi:hypothetical protein RP20_CCG013666 [Aedes albopictus]|nr:uncharacterized protein LOC109403987 [Aedes albopictus]KXJ82446.1 hypothetical protein RP20_CCG013666 [Aedes albopictus]